MSKESRLKQKRGKKLDVMVQDNAIKTLRTVEDTQAFYFYENLGKPTARAHSMFAHANALPVVFWSSARFSSVAYETCD